MAISKDKKAALLEDYREDLRDSQAVILTRYAGLTVAQMERVRRAVRQEHSDLEVLRNTLFAIAAKEAGRNALAEAPEGPTLAVFVKGDPSSPAKTLMDLSREMDALKVYAGALGDRVMSAEDVQALASLPPREVLLAQVLAGLQSPMYGFVGVLSGIMRSLVYVLQARVDQLQGPASTEAA